MRVGIFTNLHKDSDLKVTKSVIEILSEKKQIEVFLHDNLTSFGFDKFSFFNENTEFGFDMMITIGGDGTILRISKFCAKTDTPVMGINLGRLGFLADYESKDVTQLAKILINKHYSIEKRDLIETIVDKTSYISLNESAILRSGSGLLSLNVYVNGTYLDCFYCDGFIVATSVGSTAYSLSAGGPILSPFSEAFVLTPINSHSLYTRPIVINNKEFVTIELCNDNTLAELVVDGVKSCIIKQNEPIKIQNSSSCIKFARPINNNFYSKMFSKFSRF